MMRGLFGSLAIVAAIVAAIITAGSIAVRLVYRNVIMVGATGQPTDYAGASPPCPHCRHVYTRTVGGYGYRCEKCGSGFQCRTDERNRFLYRDE